MLGQHSKLVNSYRGGKLYLHGNAVILGTTLSTVTSLNRVSRMQWPFVRDEKQE